MACECCDNTNYGSGSNLYFLQELSKKVHSIKCALGESEPIDLTSIETLLNTVNTNLSTILTELQLRKYDYEVVCSSIDSRLILLKLDYIETARAGLLHDFFISDKDRSKKEKFTSTFNHSTKAVDNASRLFDINDKQKNMIRAHMCPFTLVLPKYAETWIVIGSDKLVGTIEFLKKFKYQISYVTQAYLLFIFNKL